MITKVFKYISNDVEAKVQIMIGDETVDVELVLDTQIFNDSPDEFINGIKNILKDKNEEIIVIAVKYVPIRPKGMKSKEWENVKNFNKNIWGFKLITDYFDNICQKIKLV